MKSKEPSISISYVTLFQQRTEHGRDITNLCRHEPVVMAKGAKIPVPVCDRGQVMFCRIAAIFLRKDGSFLVT